MVPGTLLKRLLPCLFLLIAASPCCAENERESARELDAEHWRGVELARAGHHDAGLAVLSGLLRKYPGSYAIERDIVIITAWKGDCRAAVRRYEAIRDYPDPEPYLVIPVSECLIKVGRTDEAVALLDEAQRRFPEDADLRAAHASAVARRAALFLHELRLEVSTNTSDQGKREWIWGASVSRRLADRTHVYVRYTNTHSSYEEFQTGKQDRLGVGIVHEFHNNVVVTQEFSDDIHRTGQNGSLTSVVFLPNDLWRFGASYNTFAEDLPLRAKAQLIDAGQSSVFTDYHSADYVWSWAASASRYDFSDTNRRNTLVTSLGYAYEMKPKREQRVFLEYYQSDNTLENAIYFNPSHDRSLSVLHKTDFVYDSLFPRHVDHLYLSVGLYDQQGFPGRAIWGVRYEQDYDFTKRTALLVGAGYARRAYDGVGEYETSVNAMFRWLF
jgi:biofilm PGA synthesis protein PgaA